MAKIHYVMPMAGRGSRFKDQGYNFPKPMIEIYGKPFFYWATRSIQKFVDIASLDFVVLQEHIDSYRIDKVIRQYFPNAGIHALPEVTEGAVITCLRGISNIDDDLPIVFNDCDHLFMCSEFNRFCEDAETENVDGLLLTFESAEDKFSFVAKDESGNVVRTAEKEPISREAICGCYYFRNRNVFEQAAQEYLLKCNYCEYFMSGVYNVMLEQKKSVRSMMTDFHVPFGIPEEYEIAKDAKEYMDLL